jgi:germination protein M
MLWSLAACAAPERGAAQATGDARANRDARATGDAGPRAAVKQRASHLSGRQLNLVVYYLRSFEGRRYLAPEWHPVPYTRAVAAAALGELLGTDPYCPGSQRPFPDGTGLEGVRVEAGTAIVDLAGAALPAPAGPGRRWALQALVHTLTQFPTVHQVLVRVGGRAVAPPLALDRRIPLAPIALAAPVPGARVEGSRLVVEGEASVFEGTVSLRLRDDGGQIMAQGHATAARAAPGRGAFSAALTFTPPATSRNWTLEAFEVSAENGDIVYAVRVPLWVGR